MDKATANNPLSWGQVSKEIGVPPARISKNYVGSKNTKLLFIVNYLLASIINF